MDKIKKVGMIGLGYIGLPTAAVMASRGLEVIGVDVNKDAIDTINSGSVHIIEPDLDIIVRSVVTTGNLRATTKAEEADAFLIAVPTPFTSGKTANLSYVKSAAQAIAPVLQKGNLVVLESTCPVGTTEQLVRWMSELRPDLTFPSTSSSQESDIYVSYCPERVLPGHVLTELVNNDRIVGGITRLCSQFASELYGIFVQGTCYQTTARTAELCKLTENAYRDVNIAFANEMSLVCDQLGINVWELIELSNRHPRVQILQPGPGVGGHCIAVDPWFIIESAPQVTALIKAARTVNDSKPHHIVDKVVTIASKFKRPTIACLGLSFKADIDDLRESPALDIVCSLAETADASLLVVEPNIETLPISLQNLPDMELATFDKAIKSSDVVVVLVDHKEFKEKTREMLNEKIVVDTRGIWR